MSFEVFELKLASRVAYGAGARYLFILTEGKKIHRTVREENECQKPSEALIVLMRRLPSSCFLFLVLRLPAPAALRCGDLRRRWRAWRPGTGRPGGPGRVATTYIHHRYV